MKQDELDRRIIYFIIGSITLMFLILASRDCKKGNEKIIYYRDTITIIEQRIDTIIQTQIKKQKIYEKDIDTIYLLTPFELSREYSKSIHILDSLNREGFFHRN